MPVRGAATMRPALAHADGGHQVHHPGREVSDFGFQFQALIRIEGRQVVEEDLVPGHRRVFEIDRLHLEEGEIALAVLGGPDLAGDGVAGAQIEAPDLGGRDVNIVGPGQIVVIRGPEEPEAVRQDLQDAAAEDHPVFFHLGLEDGENELLLSQARGPFHVEVTGQGGQIIDFFVFQVRKIHCFLLIWQ